MYSIAFGCLLPLLAKFDSFAYIFVVSLGSTVIQLGVPLCITIRCGRKTAGVGHHQLITYLRRSIKAETPDDYSTVVEVAT